MNQFQFESTIDECLGSFNGPLVNGPAPRWQRKATESKRRSTGVPLSPCNINSTPHSHTPLKTPKSHRKKGRTPLKTPRKTPQRTPSKTSTPLVDRFIPNRTTTSMNTDKSYYQLVNNDEMQLDEDVLSPDKLHKVEYERIMKNNLGSEIQSEPRILHFKQAAPTAREGRFQSLSYACK